MLELAETSMIDLFDTLKNNASVAISLCALFLTVFQARATRKHNRLAVTPYLTTFVDRIYKENRQVVVHVSLRNQGLGPAVIKDYSVIVKGKVCRPDSPHELEDLVKAALPMPLISELSYFAVLPNGYALGKGDAVVIATAVIQTYMENTREQLEEALECFQLNICYESLYKTSFTYDSREHRAPKPHPGEVSEKSSG